MNPYYVEFVQDLDKIYDFSDGQNIRKKLENAFEAYIKKMQSENPDISYSEALTELQKKYPEICRMYTGMI